MTTKEMREYEEGRAYGYTHPNKGHGWFKSAAWNDGLKAGQSEYWERWRKQEALARTRRRYREQRDGTPADYS